MVPPKVLIRLLSLGHTGNVGGSAYEASFRVLLTFPARKLELIFSA